MLKPRHLFKAIRDHFPRKECTIISGARQTGKTSLLRMFFAQLKERGERVWFLTFENPQILQAIDEHPDNIFLFTQAKPAPIIEKREKKRFVLMIDEVQYAKNPTNFLKYLYDTYEGNLKIIATGSSAFYIDKQFRDSLAGRKRIFTLYPLSFSELLSFKGADGLVEELKVMEQRPGYISPYKSDLQLLFYEYLTYGGYPAVVLQEEEEEKRFLLEELKNSYVKRDLLESGVSMAAKFYLLFQLLAEQTGNLVNKYELAGTLQIDSKTTAHYLHILEKCFHIYLLKPYFRNIRKELTKMPKVFFNDTGLRNALLNRFAPVETRKDKGALLEQFYFAQLRLKHPPDQIRYWRTSDGKEIDFIIETGFNEGLAIEIKWGKKQFKPAKYSQFSKAYPAFTLSCYDASDFWKLALIDLV